VSGTAERLMDVAEAHIRDGGYAGCSFRNLAAEIGITSASVHHHFPTKAIITAAVARRYSDRFLASVSPKSNESARDAISAYRSAFRESFERDGRMCLCGVLGAEAASRRKGRGAVVLSSLHRRSSAQDCRAPCAGSCVPRYGHA
jgi:TetR/AcrR family transcriptional repressor of nem operon